MMATLSVAMPSDSDFIVPEADDSPAGISMNFDSKKEHTLAESEAEPETFIEEEIGGGGTYGGGHYGGGHYGAGSYGGGHYGAGSYGAGHYGAGSYGGGRYGGGRYGGGRYGE